MNHLACQLTCFCQNVGVCLTGLLIVGISAFCIFLPELKFHAMVSIALDIELVSLRVSDQSVLSTCIFLWLYRMLAYLRFMLNLSPSNDRRAPALKL